MKNRIINNAVIMLLPVIIYFLIGPLEIFAGNQGEFFFGSSDFFWMFLGASAAIIILGSLILSIIPDKVERIIQALIFSVGFLSYVQNLFLNSKLMNLDGSAINWDELKTESLINLCIWGIVTVLIIVAAFLLKEKFIKVMFYSSAFLSLVQAVAIVSILFTTEYAGGLDSKYSLLPDEQYTLGSESNVILFIMDKYANDGFEERLNEDPHFADCLKDFTYYDNMNSRYAYTSPSIAYILTGFDNLHEYMDDLKFKDNAFQSEKTKEIYGAMHNQGYKTYFYTLDMDGHIFRDAKCFDDIFDNLGVRETKVDRGLLFRLLLKMSIYKSVPTIVKPKFEVMTHSFRGVVDYIDANESDYYNYDYYMKLMDEGLSIEEGVGKKLIVEHLSGAHDPFTLGGDGEYLGASDDEELLAPTQKGIMLILSKYFDELKELGLYDSSTIIIMSDHGYRYEKFAPQPIMFVKWANQSYDNMQINSAPLTSEDILPTLLKACGLDYSSYGTAITDWNEGDSRVRYSGFQENNYNSFEYDGDRSDLVELMKKEELVNN